MLKDYMGILSLSEDETSIKSITKSRTLASIPIGGRYRIIDFVLSNMVNAGIQKNIGILTQTKSRSLLDHLGSGKPWDLDRKSHGLFIFNFGASRTMLEDVEILKNNIEYLYESKETHVIFSSSYMICNIDYEQAAKYHEVSGSDITMIYTKTNDGKKKFLGCDVLNIDEKQRVHSVGKNIGAKNENCISMEMFIMKRTTLIDLVHRCVMTGYCRTVREAINQMVKDGFVNAYEFTGHVECINSLNAYYKANMNMLNLKVNKELFFEHGPIYTKVKDEAPTKYAQDSRVANSLIANGCIIEGTVENSIISRRVKIGKGAVVRNSIIMQNCKIEEGAVLEHIIVDKNVMIEKNKELKGDQEFPLVIEKKTLF